MFCHIVSPGPEWGFDTAAVGLLALIGAGSQSWEVLLPTLLHRGDHYCLLSRGSTMITRRTRNPSGLHLASGSGCSGMLSKHLIRWKRTPVNCADALKSAAKAACKSGLDGHKQSSDPALVMLKANLRKSRHKLPMNCCYLLLIQDGLSGLPL